MKILNAQKLNKDFSPVFVLKQKQKIQEHPFFELLSKDEQINLSLFLGKIKNGNSGQSLMLPGGRQVIVLSIQDGLTHRKSIRLTRRAVMVARRERIGRIVFNLEDFSTPEIPQETLAEILATQIDIANFEFVEYKEKPKDGWFFVDEAQVFSKRSIEKELKIGKIIGEEINYTRRLANTPGGDMTPQKLAEEARRTGQRAGFKVKVFEEGEIRRLKMGGIIGVSQGSVEKPRFIIMEYLKGAKGEKPTVLVGKGVTFDTGGLNLKPSEAIYEMHMDMSGGAAVIHTIATLARLGVKKNVIGLVPAVENMPSGGSYRPGDLLRTMSGKTIEVLNTDAEGRIILADALEYAKKYKPRLVIDVATLTGAAVVALGQRASAIFSTDLEISQKMQEAGETSGDLVWPLPLWEEYEEDIKGTFGDVANMGKTKYGGAISGAVFLWQFIKGYSWVHMDIAPRMTSIESDNLSKGATGAPVALLARFMRDF